MLSCGHHGSHCTRTLTANTDNDIGIAKGQPVDVEIMMGVAFGHTQTVGRYGCVSVPIPGAIAFPIFTCLRSKQAFNMPLMNMT